MTGWIIAGIAGLGLAALFGVVWWAHWMEGRSGLVETVALAALRALEAEGVEPTVRQIEERAVRLLGHPMTFTGIWIAIRDLEEKGLIEGRFIGEKQPSRYRRRVYSIKKS